MHNSAIYASQNQCEYKMNYILLSENIEVTLQANNISFSNVLQPKTHITFIHWKVIHNNNLATLFNFDETKLYSLSHEINSNICCLPSLPQPLPLNT